MAQDVTLSVGGDFGPLDKQAQQALKRLQRTFEKTGKIGGKSTHVLGSGLSAATAKANEFEKSMNAAYARVLAFGASAGIINKVTQAFSSLIKSTIEVEKSLTDINVILGASTKQLERFGSGLFKVAKDTGQTFQTVAAAATELSRQGLSAEKTLQRTKDAMILARLAGMDAVGAVEALTATLNTFNKSGLDSTKVVNKLAKVDAAFAVSSQDLAQALQRVGASAKGAGVSFDELLAIVTAAQQKTARGGAVIGNSFKTIFTRIQRPEVLNQLERLGIAVRDVQGNTLPAIKVLDGLAKTYDNLSASQKSVVSEQVAGVFQINILKAALGDLNSEYSIYQGALKASASATNEAVQRNQELNKTVSALINKTVENFRQLGATVGEATFAPAMKNLLTDVNKVMESAMKAAGTDIGQALLDGLGKFISGPGLAIVGAFTGKLLVGFFQFAKEATAVLASRGVSSEKVKRSEQETLAILKQQLATLSQMNAKRGVGRGRGGVASFALATTPVRAGGRGMIPNFAEEKDETVDARKYPMVVPFDAPKTPIKLMENTYFSNGKRGITTIVGGRKGDKLAKSDDKFLSRSQSTLHSEITDSLSDIAIKYANTMVPLTKANTPSKVQMSDLLDGKEVSIGGNKYHAKGAKGALYGAIGSAFEAATTLSLDLALPNKKKSGAKKDLTKADFDIQSGHMKKVSEFFNIPSSSKKGDFKHGDTPDTRVSMGEKIMKELGLKKVSPPKKKKTDHVPNNSYQSFRVAKALTPNFSALSEAIAREKAAGIPAGAIRVGRSSQLVTSGNPQGLAVYNTIDEPRGLSQGINRYKSAGLDPKSAGMPNFSREIHGGRSGALMGGQPGADVGREVQKTAKAVGEAAKEFERSRSAVEKFADNALTASFALSMFSGVLGDDTKTGRVVGGLAQGAAFGASLGSFIPGPYGAIAGAAIGGIGGLLSALDPVNNALAELAKTSENLNNRLANLQVSSQSFEEGFRILKTSSDPKQREFGMEQIIRGFGKASDKARQTILGGFGFSTTGVQKYLEQRIANIAEIQQQEKFELQRRSDIIKAAQNIPTLRKGRAGDKEFANLTRLLPAEVLQGIGSREQTVEFSEGGREFSVGTGTYETDASNIEQYFLSLGEDAETAANLRKIFESVSVARIKSIQKNKQEEEKTNERLKTIFGFVKAEEAIRKKRILDIEPSITQAKRSRFEAGLASQEKIGELTRQGALDSAILASETNLLRASGASRSTLIQAEGSARIAAVERRQQLAREKAKRMFDPAFAAGERSNILDVREAASGGDIDEYRTALRKAKGSTEEQKQALDELRFQLKTITQKREEEKKALANQIEVIKITTAGQLSALSTQQNLESEQRKYSESLAQLTRENNKQLQLAAARQGLGAAVSQAGREAGFARKSLGLGPAEIIKLQTSNAQAAAREQNNIAVNQIMLRQNQNKKRLEQLEIEAYTLGIDTEGDRPTDEKGARLFDEAVRLKEAQKDLNNELEIQNKLFAIGQEKGEKVAEVRRKAVQEQISLSGTMNDIFSEFAMSQEAIQAALSDNMKQVAREMKTEFKSAFKSFIDGSKSASEAFRSFATTVLDKLLDMSLNYGTNQLFAAIGFGGKQFANGGMVSGGSGVRDDVPAMLTGGEFVVKKSAVDALGVGFMNRINSYAEGGVVGANQFEMGTLGTRGKFNVSSRLSSLAITSTSNPQNALRSEMAQADEQRVTRYQEYIERKRQAMAAFKAAKSQRRIGAVMNAAMIIGASALANAKGSGGEGPMEGPLMEDGSFYSPDTPFPMRVPTGRAQGGSMSTSIAPVKPMGTSASASPMSFVGGGGGGAAAMLAASIQQLSASIQSGGSAGGGETSVNLTFNIDKSGNTKSEQNTEKKTGQPSSTEDQEKEKQFGEMIKSVVLDTITQQKRPGGLLFKAN